jgi:hypothetical protein
LKAKNTLMVEFRDMVRPFTSGIESGSTSTMHRRRRRLAAASFRGLDNTIYANRGRPLSELHRLRQHDELQSPGRSNLMMQCLRSWVGEMRRWTAFRSRQHFGVPGPRSDGGTACRRAISEDGVLRGTNWLRSHGRRRALLVSRFLYGHVGVNGTTISRRCAVFWRRRIPSPESVRE